MRTARETPTPTPSSLEHVIWAALLRLDVVCQKINSLFEKPKTILGAWLKDYVNGVLALSRSSSETVRHRRHHCR